MNRELSFANRLRRRVLLWLLVVLVAPGCNDGLCPHDGAVLSYPHQDATLPLHTQIGAPCDQFDDTSCPARYTCRGLINLPDGGTGGVCEVYDYCLVRHDETCPDGLWCVPDAPSVDYCEQQGECYLPCATTSDCPGDYHCYQIWTGVPGAVCATYLTPSFTGPELP